MVDAPQWSKRVHYRRFSANRGQRQATTHDFPEAGEIWVDVVDFLCSTTSETAASHHLVKDEHDSELSGEFPEALKKALLGRYEAHVSRNRLQYNGGHPFRIGLQVGADAGETVVFSHKCHTAKGLGNTLTVRGTKRQRSRPSSHQKRIRMTVIATGELDDLRPACIATGETQGGHGRFCARGGQADLLY